MSKPAWTSRLKKTLRRTMTTPQLAAVLPAAMVAIYWLCGEQVMIVAAILFPSLLFLGMSLTRSRPQPAQVKDMATGLPLQHKLQERLEHGFTSDDELEKLCIVIELDEVQTLHSQLGQDGMHRLLATVADRLRSSLRETDLVCAMEPGRFGISVDKQARLGLEGVLQLAARLQSSIGEPISIDQKRVMLSCCIGFSLPHRCPDATGEALLTAAESALFNALAAGPGSIRAYDYNMPRPTARSDYKNEDLESALDDGEIQHWFQPQICAKTGKLTGCEALARWKHPRLGLVAPGAFLAEISKAGLMDRMREVILHASLSAIAKWDRQGVEVPAISVNLSADELNNPVLHEILKWELDRFDIAANRLALEVSETFVSNSLSDVAKHNISSLKNIGCKIDLSGYGTGNASIAVIEHLNVNRMKLDRSLITHADSDASQQKIVNTALGVAHHLGIEAVAEGVETAQEQRMLSKLGCEHLQGYFIAKPMPADGLSSWLQGRDAQRSGCRA